MRDKYLRWLISPFPPDSFVRRIGKRLVRGMPLKQDFFGGVIYFDAVGQSWAFKGVPYEKLDAKLRDDLLALSKECSYFIDIGCNVGAMTLSVLLRNKNIRALCFDPNPRAISLFQKSVRANELGSRVTIQQAAVGNENGFVHMQFDGRTSEMGYVSSSGERVKCIDFVELVSRHSADKCLVKMDVEGFETTLLERIGKISNLRNTRFVIELHALGYNSGDPITCLDLLKASGATVKRLDGLDTSTILPHEGAQILAEWH